MLSKEEASVKLLEALPERTIEKVVDFDNFYVFQAFHPDPIEGQYDPFFSVNKETGEVRDFSWITDGGPELERAFEEA